ncbi:MAG: hypothetical protein GOVbin8609_9 [Prokaryotic dsDNA virus sp.]|nr:MAG: hypothetical protein GOVbin8609_9 [Prokaryotic dsDNA virus sp.]|tara:strand:- start:3445 stop:3936 length:492 start_codon:yes stop_codon:yes gene_type:complete
MDINKVMESGNVERFHQAVGVTKQKLSEHQWGVAMLMEKFFPNCTRNAIMYALTHDIGELYTGDIPATTKWANPDIKTLLDEYEEKIIYDLGVKYVVSDEEARQLKLCDCLEGMTYCAYRYEMGEIHAQKPFTAWYGFLASNFNDMLIGDIKRYLDELVERTL